MLRAAGVLPVVTAHSIAQALDLAGALFAGGMSAIEITLRTPVALVALGAIKRSLPQLRVGAGTVTTVAQARAAVDQGVDFLVTPGSTASLGALLAALPLPVVPGAATPAEMMALIDLGFDAAKLFPAGSLGGIGMVKALAGPFPGLGLCPTGGVNETNVAEYLQQPNVLCVGGSWMVAPEWINKGDYAQVEASARRARAAVDARPSVPAAAAG